MERVISIFKEICAIPRGSGNRIPISDYCVRFARKRGLSVRRDSACNVVIEKAASPGYEKAEPVILQGHLDMVCQKTEESEVDFLRDGIQTMIEGDFMLAVGTTLGADNGIAVAMILAILERQDLAHPALEAVLTVDEEIGLLGADQLNKSLLRGRRMINLDGEDENSVMVSCAGGVDYVMRLPLEKKKSRGTISTVTVFGLRGGHSGAEIGNGRLNANLLLGSMLGRLHQITPFEIVSLSGGDKGNAIPPRARAILSVRYPEEFKEEWERLFRSVREENSVREPNLSAEVTFSDPTEIQALTPACGTRLLCVLSCVPNGVVEMSAEVSALVETSLNLGILAERDGAAEMHFLLRSNKRSALEALKAKMEAFAFLSGSSGEFSGDYPPWEYREKSPLRERYLALYADLFGKEARVEAIHAGLECGVFDSAMPGLDCIAIGPNLYGIHTVEEKMSLSSAERIYKAVCALLADCRD